MADAAGEASYTTMTEMLISARERLKRQASECYVEGDSIVLDEGRYRIHLDRCATPEAILAWVAHLCESKGWITPSVLYRFIAHAADHHGIDLRSR